MNINTRKQDIKPKTSSEVNRARVKLRGALDEVFDAESVKKSESEESSSESEEEDSEIKSKNASTLHGRSAKKTNRPSILISPRSHRTTNSNSAHIKLPLKRKLRDQLEATNMASKSSQSTNKSTESFIMKVFDRSLDLSKYDESTSLYAICRAWFLNQPRNHTLPNFRNQTSPIPKKRTLDGPTMMRKVLSNEITELVELPKPLDTNIPRFLEAMPLQVGKGADLIDPHFKKENLSKFENLSAEEILQSYMPRWKEVRNRSKRHAWRYKHARYKYNFMIIDHFCKSHLKLSKMH